MRSLLNTLRRLPEFEDLLLRIDAGRCPVAASGLSPVHRAFVAAGIALRAERPVVLLCADEVDAARLSKDVWPPCWSSPSCSCPPGSSPSTPPPPPPTSGSSGVWPF